MALSTGTTRYLLDGLSVIAQYGTDGARQAWYTQSLARIDEVLSVVNASGKFWYQTDALGSVYTLTTSTGAVQARGGYDVFGESVALSGTAVGQPFGFTGREHEADSGLVYARARYLQPGVGTWARADPAGFLDGTNHYRYVRNRPTALIDQMGLFGARLHHYIAQTSAGSALPQSEIPAIQSASDDADKSEYQAAWYSYRHGMRASGQSIEAAILAWSEFVIGRLASAIEEYDCDRSRALLALGHGFHAVTDAEVRVHRFMVWSSWDPVAVAAHVLYEQDLREDDADTMSAINAARYYFDAFAAGRRSARIGAEAFVRIYYRTELLAHAQWLVSQ